MIRPTPAARLEALRAVPLRCLQCPATYTYGVGITLAHGSDEDTRYYNRHAWAPDYPALAALVEEWLAEKDAEIARLKAAIRVSHTGSSDRDAGEAPRCPACGSEDGVLGTSAAYFVCHACKTERYWTPTHTHPGDWLIALKTSPWGRKSELVVRYEEQLAAHDAEIARLQRLISTMTPTEAYNVIFKRCEEQDAEIAGLKKLAAMDAETMALYGQESEAQRAEIARLEALLSKGAAS